MDDRGLSADDADRLIDRASSGARRQGNEVARLLGALRAEDDAPEPVGAAVLIAHMAAAARQAAAAPVGRSGFFARLRRSDPRRTGVGLAVVLAIVGIAATALIVGRSDGGRVAGPSTTVTAGVDAPVTTGPATTIADTSEATTTPATVATTAATTAAPTVAPTDAPTSVAAASEAPLPTSGVEPTTTVPAAAPVPETTVATLPPIVVPPVTVKRPFPTTTIKRGPSTTVVTSDAPTSVTEPPTTQAPDTTAAPTPPTQPKDTNTLCAEWAAGDRSVIAQLQAIADQAGETIQELCAPPSATPLVATTVP